MDAEEDNELVWFRVGMVHSLYVSYYILLWAQLGKILSLFPEDHPKDNVIIAGVFVNILFIASQIVLIWLALKKRWNMLVTQTWCHGPMIVFILFSIGPYGAALNYQYKYVNPRFFIQNITTINSTRDNMMDSCFDLRIPQESFFLFQIIMILLVATYLLYPFPNRQYAVEEYYAIGISFLNAFDMMDLLSDIGCIQTYSNSWFVLLFTALAVSAILLAFPVGLEQIDEDDPEILRRIISVLTLVFTDILFCTIRLSVMINEGSLQSGFNFFIKNLLAAFIRIVMIVHVIRNDNKK